MLVFKENVKGFLLDTDKDKITQIFTEALSAEEVKWFEIDFRRKKSQ